MAQDTITAHIKLPDTDWQSLGNHARNHDLTTAQLVRRVLRGWLDGQVYVHVTNDGPLTAQSCGHRGFYPHTLNLAEAEVDLTGTLAPETVPDVSETSSRPSPAPLTHVWVPEDTARSLGFDPDTLPLQVSANLAGDGYGVRSVQIPKVALDFRFGRR